MATLESLARELSEVDAELARRPDPSVECVNRVAAIMATASTVDISRSSFSLGLVHEALRPMRERQTLLAHRARTLAQLEKATKNAPKDAPDESRSMALSPPPLDPPS